MSTIEEDLGNLSPTLAPHDGSLEAELAAQGHQVPTPEKPVEGTLSQIGHQLKGSFTTQLPKMGGEALQYFSPEGSSAEQLGKDIATSAKAREAEYAPDLRDKNEAQKALITGAQSLAPSIAAASLYGLSKGKYVAPVATVGLFGGSQGQETKDKLLEQGVAPEEARKAGILSGLIQGGGEAVANKFTAGVAGMGKKAVAEGMKGLVGREADTAVLKPFAKSIGEAIIAEPATEAAQDVGTQAVEQAYGAKPEQGYGETAYQSALGALGMTALLAPLGLAGHGVNSRRAAYIKDTLDNPDAPIAAREAVVDHLHKIGKEEGLQDADEWKAQALENIKNKQPVGAEKPAADFEAVPTPEAPTIEVPPNGFTPAEVAGEAPTAPPAPGLDPAIPSFVDRYDAALAAGKTTAASATLRKAATTAGVQPIEGESDLDLFTRLKEVVYPKTEVQKAEENVAAVVETQKSQLGTGAVSAAAAAAIDNGLTPEIQAAQAEVEAAREREAIQAEQEGGDQFDDTIPGWESPQTGWDKRMLAEAAAHEAEHQFEENDYAEYDPETGEIYGGGSPRVESAGGTPISGAGLPQSGQENRNIQTEEIGNGKSENQTAQTTPEEVNAGSNLDRSAAEGMAEVPVPATGGTESQPDTSAKPNEIATAVPTPRLDDLRGPKNADMRVKLIEIATGAKVPKTQATITNLKNALYLVANIDPNQSQAKQDADFAIWHRFQGAPIDYVAQKEAAASPFNDHAELPENRAAQKKANTEFQDIPLAIENPEGSIRKGKDWETEMKAHYGYIPGTKGADGDYLDTFVKPGLTQADIDAAKSVYVVDQINPETGKFDEAKVMLGYSSEQEAKDAYHENYSADWKGFGNITEVPIEEFKERLGQDWSGPQEKPQFSRPDVATQFEAFGKFDKAPEGVDPRMAFIQNNFLDLLSELEASGKVQIKC